MSGTVVRKRKILKNFKNIQTNNKEFVSFLETLDRYELEEMDKNNLSTLKEHLNNMTVLFQELADSVNNKKKN